jgi:hypothetical protein
MEEQVTESAPSEVAEPTEVGEALNDLGIEEDSLFKYSELSDQPSDVKELKKGFKKDVKADDDEIEVNPEEKWLDTPEEETEEVEESEEIKEEDLELLVAGVKYKLPKSKVIEMAQKGFDYTVKTQGLSEDRKIFEKEMHEKTQEVEQFKSQYENDIYEKQQLDYFFDHLRNANPDLYATLQGEVQQFTAQTRNPVMERQNQMLMKELNELKSTISNMSVKEEKASLAKELAHLEQNVFPKYLKYGIKPDKNRVIQEWVEHGGTLEDSFKKIYGDHFLSVADGKSKLAKAQGQTKRIPTAGKVKSGKPAAKKINLRGLSYHNIAERLTQGSN